MAKKELSIIIPVYNVEKYIELCLKSILQQNKNNLEIILIDDGSTDCSGVICDSYQRKFDNIKVIHQKNQGLSSARNKGIEQSKGTYILFVDSDDYLCPNAISKILSDITKNYDLYCYKYQRVIQKGNIDEESDFPEGVYNGEDSCKFLFNQKIHNYIWRFVIRRNVMVQSNIFFPVNRNFEDRATTYKLFLKSRKVFFDKRIIYNYVSRNNSITTSKEIKNYYDDFIGLQERLTYIENNYIQLLEDCIVDTYISYIGIYRMFCELDLKKTIKIRASIRKHISCKYIIKSRKFPLNKRVQLLLIKMNLMEMLYPLVNWVKKI